jgi:hypothetical protein
MRWREALHPIGMQRVALLAPTESLRDLLVTVADLGCVDLDDLGEHGSATAAPPAAASLQRVGHGAPVTALVARQADLTGWEQNGRVELIAGEAQLEERATRAVTQGRVSALIGWAAADTVPPLARAAAAVDGAVVVLPAPRGVDPPTLLSQQGVARESGEHILRFQLLLSLLRQPRWIAGVALSAGSFVIQGVAFAFGPLTLVQPLAATDVLFALPFIARRNRRGLTRRDAAGALTVTAGIAVFLTVSPPSGGTSQPGLLAWSPVFIAIGGLSAGAGLMALRARGQAQVLWLAAAAACCFGLLDALTKSTVDIISSQGVTVVFHWEPYALGVAGLFGALFGQSAFGAGPLSLSLPVIDTLEPVSAVVIGATVFGERLASSPGQLAVQLAGGAVAATGIALLSRSSIVMAEAGLPPAALRDGRRPPPASGPSRAPREGTAAGPDRPGSG